METRVWLFGAVWLIAGALLFCGTSAQIIEINTMRYNKHENKAIRVIARFDRCPQHNFRNNFYHALTCAGFVRAHMDDLERKLNKKTLDWNADINEKLAENVDKPCYDNAQFKVFYYDENQLIFLRFGEHGSHVSYWITENLQKKYKNNENETVFVQFPHPDEWEFIAYANLGDFPLSNHVCDPESGAYYTRTKQFRFPYSGSFDLRTKKLTVGRKCAAPSPKQKIMQNDPTMYVRNRFTLNGADLFPYRRMKYFNQVYDKHTIVSLNYPLRGYMQSKHYVVVVYKNDEEDRRLVEQNKARDITLLAPCYIRVIRPDLRESHEMLMTPYSASHRFVILEEDGPRQKDTSTTTTTTTTTTPRTTTTPKARKSSLLTTTTTTTTTTTPIPTTIEVIQLEIHEGNSSREYSDVPIWNDITDVPDIVQQKSRTIVLSMDYYDDQDAVDIAVKSKMKKLQPVKEKFTASTHLNGVFLVSLITAGFVFYM